MVDCTEKMKRIRLCKPVIGGHTWTSSICADKLDGLRGSGKRKREDMAGLDDYLQLPDDYATRTSEPGKKRVNWTEFLFERNVVDVTLCNCCIYYIHQFLGHNTTISLLPFFVQVRWADLEEQKDADRKRAIGFVVGQTDWERITDESGQLAQRALNRTKYF